jgi:hypothetical protein
MAQTACTDQSVGIFIIILFSWNKGVDADHMRCMDDFSITKIYSYMSDFLCQGIVNGYLFFKGSSCFVKIYG